MNLAERDIALIWHPFRSYGAPPPIGITGAKGAKIFTDDGRELIDGFSSWWVNVHGHNHPHITAALKAQLDTLHHVAFADFTHEPAVQLAERVVRELPDELVRVFFSDDGSTSVEAALKMAIHYWLNRGEQKRKKIVALEDAYHGDTFGSMSTGARGLFTAPFESYLFEVARLPSPVSAPAECVDRFHSLAAAGDVAAFIYEPLLQAASGMLVYTEKVLAELLAIARRYDVVTIADEVMTGFGRTGTMFVSGKDPALVPDIICLSKGLTGGTLPLGLTVCSEKIFEPFKNPDRAKTFFHSHSYTANPLVCAAANASLDLFQKKETWEAVARIGGEQEQFARQLEAHPRVGNARSLGTMFACDVETPAGGYLSPIRELIMNFCLARGVYLRPLGNVIYFLPPYCTSPREMKVVHDTILACLEALP